MVWYFEDRWITRLPVSHIPLTILGLMSWCSTLKMDGFSYLLVFLQLIPPYSSAAVCCTLISLKYLFPEKYGFSKLLAALATSHQVTQSWFFPQLRPLRCTSTGENRPRNSIHRKSPDICLGLSLPVFSASFNYKALFNYWMKEAGKPKQLEHA